MGQDASAFPEELFKLDTLPLQDQNWWDCLPISKIDLSNNLITIIPDKLTIFPDLQLIRLRNNLITALPASLLDLPLLKVLDLSRNKITTVPPELSLFPSLV